MSRRSFRVAVSSIVVSIAAGPLAADGTIRGRARFERIAGTPAMGHIELYESNLFASPDGGGPRGPSYRLGAPPGAPPRGDGSYEIDVEAGSWSLYVAQPLFFIRPRLVPGVIVRDGRVTTRDIDLPIDYSTYFTDEWTTFERVWLQTFVATGTSITGVSWKLAGTNATEIECSILEDDGGADPSAWPRVSARAAKRDSVAARADNWVRWRSGQVPTTPGKRYAVRLEGVAGGDRAFAVFRRRKDARSYSGGSAYRDGNATPRGYDLNVTVFSDSDDTAILLAKTTEGLGELRDGNFGGRWGQTFRATQGASLAAVDVWAAGADRNWDIDFTWRVFRGAPGGEQVGPTKTTRAAFQAFGAGLHAVSFGPEEVPLVAGETYYIEFTGAEGFNPYVMTAPEDAYADGAPYQDRARRSGFELAMTVMVHRSSSGDSGAIEGEVRDRDSRAAIPRATVEVVELARQATSDAAGAWSIGRVPEGTWTLTVTKAGYEEANIAGVSVAPGETARVDVELEAEPCGAAFRNGGFEDDLRGWTRYGDARGRTVDTSGGGWFGGIRAREGDRFHGNEINGCCLNGGLWQRFCAVPGHTYRVTAWSNVYWIEGGSADAVNRVGVDPGGGAVPASDAIVWSTPHRQPRSSTEGWRALGVDVVAESTLMTVFLDFRQEPAPGDTWRINCFDLVAIEDLDAGHEPRFERGDCDASAIRDLTDAVFLLRRLFLGGAAPDCDDACDTNDDGTLEISDAVFLLEHLFLGGPDPAEPFPDCGPDETADDGLGCERPRCPGA